MVTNASQIRLKSFPCMSYLSTKLQALVIYIYFYLLYLLYLYFIKAFIFSGRYYFALLGCVLYAHYLFDLTVVLLRCFIPSALVMKLRFRNNKESTPSYILRKQ